MSGLAILLAAWLAGCGGEQGAEPPTAPQFQEGRVLLDNQTGYAVEVAYLNPRARIVRSRVEAGQRQDVALEVLPGGLEVEFDLVLLLPPEAGFRVRRKARVQIDGEVLLRARLEDPADPFTLQVGVAAAG